MIDSYLLENLAAFARCGTLSAAAEELHVSQPSLSRSMQKLEQEIGVPLFERTKNRIGLNSCGRVAAEYAQRIIEQQNDMVAGVRAAYRAEHTIDVGGCAPMPLSDIAVLLTRFYPEFAVSSEILDDETLRQKLSNGTIQLAIFHRPPEEEGLIWKVCGHERLCACLPRGHQLADRETLRLRDLAGLTFLQHSKVGFWYPLVKSGIPGAKFLLQDEYDTFSELLLSSAIPSFSTDVTIRRYNKDPLHRVNVPLSDPEVNVTYYLACRQEQRRRFRALFAAVEELE